MMKAIPTIVLAALVAACGGGYYQVRDSANGRTYYTRDVDNVGAGAVRFKDEASGAVVTVQRSEVKSMTRDDYQAAIRRR